MAENLTVILINIIEIAVILPVIVYIIWYFYRPYLIKQLKARLFNGTFILFHEDKIVDILRKGVLSAYPEISAYYLRLLEDVNIKNYTDDLIGALDYKNDDIKEYAIKRIKELKIVAAVPKLLNLTKAKSEANRVRSFAAEAYLSLAAKEEIFSELKNLLIPEGIIGTIIGLLQLNDKNADYIAMQKLGEMIKSNDDNERSKAAEIIGFVSKGDFTYPLTFLAYDESLKVKKQVIRALARMKSPKMIDYLVKRLYETDCKREAFSALIAAGKDVIYPLADIINSETEKTSVTIYLIEIIGQIMGVEGKDALLNCLIKAKNRRIKEAVLKVLEYHPLVIEKSSLVSINTMINKETENVIWLLRALVDISKDERIMTSDFKDTLITAFKNDIAEAKRRIISLCNLPLLPKEKVNADNICNDEQFDTLKANGIKFKKVELFSKLSSRIVLGRVDKDYPAKSKDAFFRLREVILSSSEKSTKWLRACSCYMAFLVEKKSFIEVFKQAKDDKSQIVRETAVYALNNMNDGAENETNH